MNSIVGTLLVVDRDREFAQQVSTEAARRGYRPTVAPTIREAVAAAGREVYEAVLIDLDPGAERAFELLAELKRAASDAEVIVTADSGATTAAIQWFDPDAFTFARRSDFDALFATVGSAVERARMRAENRRLVWELQTVNDIAAGIAGALDLQDVLSGALDNLARAMNALAGSIRLRDDATGSYDVKARTGPAALQQIWDVSDPMLPRPSDYVLATRSPLVVEDFASLVAAPSPEALLLRSAISVPMFAGDDLVGVLSLGSSRVRRFEPADRRLLGTIAGQLVVALQSAQLHQRVLRAKREWEQTFDAISDPVAVFDHRGGVLRGNRALAAHLGQPVEALRRLSCAEVGFCGGHRDAAPCSVGSAATARTGRRETTESHGRIFCVTTFPGPATSEGPSVVQIAKDVTEETLSARRLQQLSAELAERNQQLTTAVEQVRATQAHLIQAEKLSAIGRLDAGVAHELNNPLTSVIGYAQLVEEELRGSPGERPSAEVVQDLRRIADEAERAAGIVRNLLAFARRQTAARSAEDATEFCRRVLALRDYERRLSGTELDLDLPAGLPRVFVDGGHLQQVLLNLVLNAERAMYDAPVRRLTVRARYDEAAAAVEIIVRDTGHGIEPENLSRVFDPFFTTREVGEGSGLGLSICYGIVRDHGGEIRVDSEPGVGTTFTLALPARVMSPDADSATVLVAHADRAEREFMAAALNGWGYHTIAVASAGEALEVCRESAVDVAIVERGARAAVDAAWRALPGGGPALLLVEDAGDGEITDYGDMDGRSAVLVPPVTLRRLHAGMREGKKECV